MTSINDDVENILNGKFDADIGLGFFNDMNFGLQPQPSQFSPPLPSSAQNPAAAAALAAHNSPSMGQMPPHTPHTPHMPQMPQMPPVASAHAPPQHTPQVPKQQIATPGPPPPANLAGGVPQPQFRAAPQQMPGQLVPPMPHGHHGNPVHAQPHHQHGTPLSVNPALPGTPNLSSTPQSATTPGGAGRPHQLAERINCLLHINNELIKQVTTLPPRSPIHAECLKRLEVNVAYLHGLAADARAHQTAQTMPAIMQAPMEVPSLSEPYHRLSTLTP